MSPLLWLVLLCPNGVGSTGGTPGQGGQAGGEAAKPRPACVTALAAAPDQPLFVAGKTDGSLHRVRIAAGETSDTPAGKLPAGVAALAVGPGGRALVATDAGHLALLEPEATEPRVLGRHAPGAMAVALEPGEARGAIGGADGVIAVWDLAAGKQLFTLAAHEGPVAALAFADDKLWSAGWDGVLRGWRLNGKSGKSPGKWALGKHELTALAAAPDGSRLLVAGHDGALAWFEPGAKKPAPRPLSSRPHGEWIRALAFSPRGKRAAAIAAAESAVLVLDPERGLVATLEQPLTKVPSAVAWTPEGDALVVGRFDGTFGRLELPPEGKDLP